MASAEQSVGSRQKTAGVLGGMGPQATVDFINAVIARTPANRDQDHLRLYVDSNPHVPDRQAAMRGDDTAVRAALRDMALGLERQGADFLVMPCNTAHVFVDDAVAAVGIPFVSIIAVTIGAVSRRVAGAGSVALLATDACVASGIYQRAAEAAGMRVVLPDAEAQRECMRLIAAVKGGDVGAGVRRGMRSLAARVTDNGVDALIAGCTEIPLVLDDDEVGVPLISSTDQLADATVDYALGRRGPPTHTDT